MCCMSRSWSKHTIVALGLTHALVGCQAKDAYYEYNISYSEIERYNQYLKNKKEN